MTERIDLDEFEEPTDTTDEKRREGDWLWRDGEDVPEDRPGGEWTTGESSTTPDSGGDDDGEADEADGDGRPRSDVPSAVPHVPTSNGGDPVGIPASSGGSGAKPDTAPENGGVPPDESASEDAGSGPGGDATRGDVRTGAGTASAHGSAEPDDMTMAFTYGAIQRLADPGVAFADAERWCDWLGLVGDVDGHVLNKFQRDERLDLDFFNGTGTGPGERLAEVDERSMFFADRMVVVGRPDEEWLAELADWEFVPLERAAEEAGWELTDDSDAAT